MSARLSTGLTSEIKATILGCLNNAADMAIEEVNVDTAAKREAVKKISAATAYIETLTPASERVAPEEPPAANLTVVPDKPARTRAGSAAGKPEPKSKESAASASA